MDRRRFLALCGALTTGCLGGQPNGTPEGVSTTRTTSQWTPTPRPPETATETATETQTETETETPESSDDAEEAIETARTHLAEAVHEFRGGEDSLTDVSAASDDFSARGVLLELDAAQRAIWRAQRTASTDDQTATAESLHAVERFLTYAAVGQTRLVATLESLEAVYSALDEREYDTAEDRDDDLNGHRNRALDAVNTALDAATVEDAQVASVDDLDDDEFEAKAAHLERERDGVADLGEAVDLILDGVDSLQEARDYYDDGDYGDAEDAAEGAERRFDRALELTDDVYDDGPDSLAGVAADLDDFAYNRAQDAADIIDDVE